MLKIIKGEINYHGSKIAVTYLFVALLSAFDLVTRAGYFSSLAIAPLVVCLMKTQFMKNRDRIDRHFIAWPVSALGLGLGRLVFPVLFLDVFLYKRRKLYTLVW